MQLNLKTIRDHYKGTDHEEEFAHVVDKHQPEIMELYRRNYSSETFDVLDVFMRGLTTGETVNEKISELMIAAAELVYEGHDDTEEGER
jgi:hypothetical protein